MSLPARGAWVETDEIVLDVLMAVSLPARGAWVETMPIKGWNLIGGCRSPQGERGLKRVAVRERRPDGASLPARGAWVETTQPPL